MASGSVGGPEPHPIHISGRPCFLVRADQFKEVAPDLKDITYIGQVFAGKVFRVFKLEHSEVIFCWASITDDIEK